MVEEALEIDWTTNTDFWRKAINKEMAKVKIAWITHDGHTPQQVREGKASEFIGFQKIGCHIVFDIKMDFTRKARFVTGGHTTTAPTSITYLSVVSRDSVRLAFLIAALNNIDIMSCDLENVYLNAPCREKIWFEAGIECGKDQGKPTQMYGYGRQSGTAMVTNITRCYSFMWMISWLSVIRPKMLLRRSLPSTRQRTGVSNHQRFISAPMSLKCNYLTVEKFGPLHPRRMSRMHLLLVNGFYKKTGTGTY
jgi:hypothetical protein